MWETICSVALEGRYRVRDEGLVTFAQVGGFGMVLKDEVDTLFHL